MRILAAATVALLAGPVWAAPDVTAALASIKAVGKEGAGNEAAAAGWKAIAAAGPDAIVPTLKAFAGANPVAANWLRSAVDALVQAEAKAGRKLPAAELIAFAKDGTQDPAARRIAFELATEKNDALKQELLALMVDDPSLELRRDAIIAGLAGTKSLAGDAKAKAVRRFFLAARDVDQVEDIAKQLEDLGDKTDLTAHFGFVARWHVAGPFENKDGKGFDMAYAPEAGVDLKATYDGKAGAKFGWKPLAAAEKYGTIDLNKQVAKHKEAITYGYAVVESPKEAAVHLRAGSQNAVKIFLNGKPVFFREAYHQGTTMDQHTAPVTLKAGRNEILVKLCQNNQTEPWAQVWGFQLRICDPLGGPVAFALVSPPPTPKE